MPFTKWRNGLSVILRRKESMKVKSKGVALVLAIFFGYLGIDRFYLGYVGMGILKLLTGGLFGILWLVDAIRIAIGNLHPNRASYSSN